jgi:festuclavine dehydrogenase
MAIIWKYVKNLGTEYVTIRPNWLFENFSEAVHRNSIRKRDMIVTATGDGKVAFMSACDVAVVAVRALTDEVSHNRCHSISGKELFTYDEVGPPSVTATRH